MDVESILKFRGVRPTSNRIVVLRILSESSCPLSMKDLLERVSSLDKSSIFRSLRYLTKCHVIHEIEDGSGALKYEMCYVEHTEEHSDMHPHFYCELCKRTFCLSDISIPKVDFSDGSVIHSVNYVLKGICGKCAEKGL